MTRAGCLLSEDQFRCFCCQNVFTDPVSTPCGHNFCKKCVTEAVWVDAPFLCPVCEKIFYPKPELQVNTLVAELLDEFRRSSQRQNREAEAADPAGFHVFSRTGRTGLVFCAMILFFILSSQIKPIPPLAEETGEKPPEAILQDMMEDTKPFVWTSGWAERCLDLNAEQEQSRSRVDQLSAERLKQIFTEVMKKEVPRLLIRAELMKARRFAVEVTLDPDTLNPKLVLSEDMKQVRCCGPKKYVHHDLKRFMSSKFVLGKQSFSSGKFYFEVQVEGKTNWTIGVAKESVRRIGLVRLSPQFGFWSLTVRNGNEFTGLADPPVHFSLQSGLEKVGVFVDYQEGQVFFYDVDSAALVFSFTGCFFTERLHPFFGPGHNHDGTNSAPLVITAVPLPE